MRRARLNTAIRMLVLVVLAVVAIFPFFMMILMSTYKTQQLSRVVTMLPGNYLTQNLSKILKGGFLNYYVNSAYIATVTTVLTVFFSAMTGYGFAKFRFKFKKTLFCVVVAYMMIPSQLGLIGYVVEMRWIGMSNTREAVIAMYVANCFGAFWMTSFIRSGVPDSVLESARIDGCSEFGIFMRIVLPYVKAGLATLLILQFMWNWNNYLLPLVVLNDNKLYPLTLGIASLGNRYSADYAAQICALMLGTLPLIVIFICGSKYFISGLTAGDIKG